MCGAFAGCIEVGSPSPSVPVIVGKIEVNRQFRAAGGRNPFFSAERKQRSFIVIFGDERLGMPRVPAVVTTHQQDPRRSLLTVSVSGCTERPISRREEIAERNEIPHAGFREWKSLLMGLPLPAVARLAGPNGQHCAESEFSIGLVRERRTGRKHDEVAIGG